MPSYKKAGPELIAMADALREDDLPELDRAEVTVSYLLVEGDKADDGAINHPLKDNGWVLVCKARVTPVDLRARGLADAMISIDLDLWDELDEEEQRAHLFTALYSLQVQYEKVAPLFGDGKPVPSADDVGRPALKVRKTDFRVEGYHAAMERYGDACEAGRALKLVAGRYRSLVEEPKTTRHPSFLNN